MLLWTVPHMSTPILVELLQNFPKSKRHSALQNVELQLPLGARVRLHLLPVVVELIDVDHCQEPEKRVRKM